MERIQIEVAGKFNWNLEFKYKRVYNYVMPIISRFFGIIIVIYWQDHSPPHFHAKYGDQEVVIEIATGAVVGDMSKRALSMVQEWRKIHKKELMKNWELAGQGKPLLNIGPLR